MNKNEFEKKSNKTKLEQNKIKLIELKYNLKLNKKT